MLSVCPSIHSSIHPSLSLSLCIHPPIHPSPRGSNLAEGCFARGNTYTTHRLAQPALQTNTAPQQHPLSSHWPQHHPLSSHWPQSSRPHPWRRHAAKPREKKGVQSFLPTRGVTKLPGQGISLAQQPAPARRANTGHHHILMARQTGLGRENCSQTERLRRDYMAGLQTTNVRLLDHSLWSSSSARSICIL